MLSPPSPLHHLLIIFGHCDGFKDLSLPPLAPNMGLPERGGNLEAQCLLWGTKCRQQGVSGAPLSISKGNNPKQPGSECSHVVLRSFLLCHT